MKSGDPLAGVNVFLEGTPYGAATDQDGEYIILNIPLGNYTLRASYIGYTSYRVENIRISLDRTTHQNFILTENIMVILMLLVKLFQIYYLRWLNMYFI